MESNDAKESNDGAFRMNLRFLHRAVLAMAIGACGGRPSESTDGTARSGAGQGAETPTGGTQVAPGAEATGESADESVGEAIELTGSVTTSIRVLVMHDDPLSEAAALSRANLLEGMRSLVSGRLSIDDVPPTSAERAAWRGPDRTLWQRFAWVVGLRLGPGPHFSLEEVAVLRPSDGGMLVEASILGRSELQMSDLVGRVLAELVLTGAELGADQRSGAAIPPRSTRRAADERTLLILAINANSGADTPEAARCVRDVQRYFDCTARTCPAELGDHTYLLRRQAGMIRRDLGFPRVPRGVRDYVNWYGRLHDYYMASLGDVQATIIIDCRPELQELDIIVVPNHGERGEFRLRNLLLDEDNVLRLARLSAAHAWSTRRPGPLYLH